ncbi:MAG: Hsp20/alpha crystallin family protein [Planctomycetaceae bacterium]
MSEFLPIPSDSSLPDQEQSGQPESNERPQLLFNPPIDIYETADGLVLYADLPGVTADDLELQVQDNRLTLFGRVKRKNPDNAVLLHQEYEIGDFVRSFILSDHVDHERIHAKLNHGVLRVELPRAERARPRKIEVSS